MRMLIFLIFILSVQKSSSLESCSLKISPRNLKWLVHHPKFQLLEHQQCGDSSSDRIIGGMKAEMGEFPWLARLGYSDPSKGVFEVTRPHDFKCGGSLINHQYVLTAGHCLSNLGPEILSIVRLGEYDASKNPDCDEEGCAPPPQDIAPNKLIVHENYNSQALLNDIGLIRLEKSVQYNLFVRPICLPYGKLMQKHFLPKTFTVAGWGIKDMSTKEVSVVPLYVKLNLVDMEECRRLLRIPYKKNGQLCVGGKIGFDSCGGDSGGPLMVATAVSGPPRFFQLGIVSFGSDMCGSEKPAVYTDVRYYMSWILANMEP